MGQGKCIISPYFFNLKLQPTTLLLIMGVGGNLINKGKHFLLKLFTIIRSFFFFNHMTRKDNCVKHFHKTFFYPNFQMTSLKSLLWELHLEDVASKANCMKGMTHPQSNKLCTNQDYFKGLNAGKPGKPIESKWTFFLFIIKQRRTGWGKNIWLAKVISH